MSLSCWLINAIFPVKVAFPYVIGFLSVLFCCFFYGVSEHSYELLLLFITVFFSLYVALAFTASLRYHFFLSAKFIYFFSLDFVAMQTVFTMQLWLWLSISFIISSNRHTMIEVCIHCEMANTSNRWNCVCGSQLTAYTTCTRTHGQAVEVVQRVITRNTGEDRYIYIY